LQFRFPVSLILSFALACATAAATTKKPPLKPVNINTASAEQLQQVPGIGPATADKILQMRKSYGAFKDVDDLVSIRGIGKKRLDKMRKYLTVGKSAAQKSNQGSQHSPSKMSPAKTDESPAADPSSDSPGI
jgi:competence ComEA-like helix-hairpin-helix protein